MLTLLTRSLGWAALAYVVAISEAIRYWNNLCHYLPINPDVQDGKWRGEAREFATFCFLYGNWIFPLGVFAIAVLGKQAIVSKSMPHRIIAVIACGIVVYLINWNANLGVWSGFGD